MVSELMYGLNMTKRYYNESVFTLYFPVITTLHIRAICNFAAPTEIELTSSCFKKHKLLPAEPKENLWESSTIQRLEHIAEQF